MSQKPILSIGDIEKKLPHRFPFLFIDKVIEMSEQHLIGVKNVTINEPFFAGHFPDEPIVPGVLILEGLAQAGGLLVLSFLPDEKHSTYLLTIDKAKFRQKVIPGDVLVYEVNILTPIRRGLASLQAKAKVNNTIVAECTLLIKVEKK